MSPDEPDSVKQDKRLARLAASLRENLKRRKNQQRSRKSAPAPTQMNVEAACREPNA